MKKLSLDLEEISSKVHDAWWKEKKRQGFHSPQEGHRDLPSEMKFQHICEHCHADMYPYEELPDHVREYDRQTVRAVWKAMGYDAQMYDEYRRLALEEIARGEGPYSKDSLTHAENTIEAMKKIAVRALEEAS